MRITALVLSFVLAALSAAAQAPGAPGTPIATSTGTVTSVSASTACVGRVTPGVGSFAYNGATYTLRADGAVMRNTAPLNGGMGSVLVLTTGNEIQTLGTDNAWWRWTAAQTWTATKAGDPCPPIVQAKLGLPRIGWDQPAVSLDAAKALTYRFYRDDSRYALPPLNVTCTAATPLSPKGTFPCSAAFPTSLPGPGTITMTAATKTEESPKSNAVKFTVFVQETK